MSVYIVGCRISEYGRILAVLSRCADNGDNTLLPNCIKQLGSVTVFGNLICQIDAKVFSVECNRLESSHEPGTKIP